MPEHRIVEFEEDFLEDGMVAVCSCERKRGRMEAVMAHRDHKYADLPKELETQIETQPFSSSQ